MSEEQIEIAKQLMMKDADVCNFTVREMLGIVFSAICIDDCMKIGVENNETTQLVEYWLYLLSITYLEIIM